MSIHRDFRIYVAGSSKDIDRCERAVARCRAEGFTITEDWVRTMRTSAPDHLLDAERLTACAIADLRGVATADVVWLLAPPASKPSAGCWGEMDRAFTSKVPVVYSPPPDERPQFSIFTTQIGEHAFGRICATDDEALETIKQLAVYLSLDY